MGKRKNACRLLVGKPEGKSPLKNLGIDDRMDFREMGYNSKQTGLTGS
jgi:hypothetical protein